MMPDPAPVAPNGSIRVLIADDHTLFRDGLRALLGSVAEIAVVGEAATGAEAGARAAALQPDVILMDIQMPDTNRIEATRRILQDNQGAGILVLTMFEDDDSVFAAMRAGARGYVLKGADQAEVLRAIRAVVTGKALFGPTIATRLTTFFAAPPAPKVFPELTDREREILDLIAQGRNNTEIAARLYLSPKTVRNHIASIFAKLQVADRAQATVRARGRPGTMRPARTARTASAAGVLVGAAARPPVAPQGHRKRIQDE